MEITKGLKSFAAVDRFLAEVAGDARRAGYVLLGDEAYLQQRARRGLLDALLPREQREFSLHDIDLSSEMTIFDALDLAQTPSLMAPFQVLFIRNLKSLYGRGQKKEEFKALDEYFRRPNPGALLVFVADHISLPQDLRRMDMTEKERAEKIRETLGDGCGVIELQRVSAEDATTWVQRASQAKGVEFSADAAHELVDSLGADMLAIESEVEKLTLFAGAQGKQKLDVPDIEEMVSAAKQRGVYELTDAISQKDAPRALALLHGLLNASEGGDDAAIGHVFTLAKTYRQMLVLNENRVTDQRAMWQVLWPGFRVAPFAADQLIAQARRYRDRAELRRGLRWIAKADIELRSSPLTSALCLNA
ncbi:DNA polymerase III subunit delta [Granulicella cerasi]|uniref:DNA polymerase III subunit delta n=1 Tax=Granulicella cerasi TaxID=741063 RepID=A0ABW1ZDS2_9BACT